MIVKNEEKVLGRCLDSIKEAVDEIIIVDTGSTDKTKETAAKYTDKIFDFEWIDDFSAARNYAFSKGKCDFLMWLDADDVVTPENTEKLLRLKENLEGVDAVMMKYNTAFDETGSPVFSYYRERLLRRDMPHRWKGRVHEAIECKGNILYSDVEINHASIKTEYGTRNLEIYEKQAASGEKMKPRDVFYYARELYYNKRYNEAIVKFKAFTKDKRGWVENKIEAYRILCKCYLETGRSDEALNALFASFKYDTPRAEVCCDAGDIFMKRGEFDKAVFWFELALAAPKKDERGGFSEIDSHGYLPCIQLCVCYDRLKDYKKAEEYNERAGAFRPKSKAYEHNRKYFQELHKQGVI